MNLQVDVLDGTVAPERLRAAWARLLERNVAPPGGLDATSGPVWFEAVVAAFGKGDRSRVVVLREGESVVALLPLVVEAGRRLMAPTMLHGGRNGFLLGTPSAELLGATLGNVRQAFGAWLSLRMMLVEGSEGEALLAEVCTRYGYRAIADSEEPSPYFPLLADAAEFSARMSKGLKQTLRTAANKLKALGVLELREIGPEADADWAIESILTIERASWKQEAGTAITCHPEQERFYRELFPRAARAGLLYGQIALLNGRPIAYNFGLLHAGVFCCLKHSQTLEHQGLSPGQLINAEMIGRVRERGAAVYDFMGKVEPHKMRWSDANGLYTRRHVWIYPPTLGGRLAWLLHTLKRRLRRVLRRAAPAAPAADAGSAG
jgi:CelD/BcsL family acetyltransferase involved in cellulose biosynthesis